MFTYEYPSTLECILLHLTVDCNKLSASDALLLKRACTGIPWVCKPKDYALLKDTVCVSASFSKPILYCPSIEDMTLLYTQTSTGMYKDEMPSDIRKVCLPYEMSIAKTPLEVMYQAWAHIERYKLYMLARVMKSYLGYVEEDSPSKGLVLFINCFDKQYDFVDKMIGLRDIDCGVYTP